MNLTLSAEQRMLQAVARDFVARELPMAMVREIWETRRGFPSELWRKMTEMGWLGLPFPVEYGGSGLGLVEMGLVLEQMGWGAVASPYLTTTGYGGWLILHAGTVEEKVRLLPRIARGELRVSVAPCYFGASPRREAYSIVAKRIDHHWCVDGVAPLVEFAKQADLFLVLAGEEASLAKANLFAIEKGTCGTELHPIPGIDNVDMSDLVFRGVRRTSSDMIVHRSEALLAAYESAVRVVAALRCAEMVGGSRKVLEMTVQYAKQRMTYGRPIGTSQKLQHYCADAAVLIEGAWLATYRALWLLSRGRTAAKETAVAKLFTGDTYTRSTIVAAQIHGGVGHLKEHDLPLYYRRAKGDQLRLGGLGEKIHEMCQVLDF